MLKKSRHDSAEKKQQVLTKAVIRLAEMLHLSRSELSVIIGRSEASLSRMYTNEKFGLDPATKEGQLALLLTRLFRNLDTLFGGNVKQAQLWLRNKNLHLNAIPVQLIQSVEGLVSAVQYLDAMRGKI